MDQTSRLLATSFYLGILSLALLGCPRAVQEDQMSAVQVSGGGSGVTPVPEYDPSQAVMVSSELAKYINADDFLASVAQSGIKKVVVLDSQNSRNLSSWGDRYNQLKVEKINLPNIQRLSLWVRDFGPFWVKQNSSLAFLDFNYLRNGKRDLEDQVPSAYQCKAGIPSVKVDLTLEGGNLALARSLNKKLYCLTSDEFTEYNKNAPLDALKRAVGCEEVLVFPSLLGERTRHVDIWLKPLKDGVIAVGDISEQSVKAAVSLGDSDEDDPPEDYAQSNKEALNNAANTLQTKGFTVVRIPMPTPITHSQRYRSTDHIYRTYVNSLILNNHVFVPRYTKADDSLIGKGLTAYPDQHLIAGYERSVLASYQKQGLTVHWIPSDFLITQGGSVHCVTMQIPH
jgi:agmatine deiminase